jgi:murein DD-endopeptidase MepM/ murein hydrolase activator NlpD
MSLKDSLKGDSSKDFFNILKLTIEKNAIRAAETLKTLNSDLITQVTDFRIEKLSGLSRNAKIRIGAGVMGTALICTAIFLNAGTDVYKLTIAGKDAGYISDTKLVAQAVEEVKADLSKKSGGVEFTVDDKSIAYKQADLKAKDVSVLTDDQLKAKILSANICKANVWAVNINGANVVATATETEANSILEGVKNHYLTNGSEVMSAGFKESVTVTKAAMSAAEIMKPEDAVTLILTGTKEPKVYTVLGGDTIWDIAIANGMTPADLAAANPGFDPDTLKIGQQLNLFQIKPFVTVLTKEVVAATEKIDFKTVYESSNALYKGETKVKTPGVYGSKEVKTEVTKENGVVVASNQLASEVTAQPQDQIALKGTKSIALFSGTGSLSCPVAHIEISSAFGSRGGGRHTGVDFRDPKGTPIYAADDGVVIKISNSGSPGRMVKLSHGNGVETWYEHCDTIIVSVGQVVKKGQQIATVGATGNATGYHLHFEVRVNGVPQNPMNYL